MERKIVVVTAAYGRDCIASMRGQAGILPVIAAAGADGVEIRRELLNDACASELNALAQAAKTHNLFTCYSAPQTLFREDGRLNPDIPALLQEAQRLNACWLKLSLGHYRSSTAFTMLETWLMDSGIQLMIENDQTLNGRLAPMQRFQSACRVFNMPLKLTFDMANWLWIEESPDEAARILAPAVGYIHVKAATFSHGNWRAIPPDQTQPGWQTLLKVLPSDVPRGIEFPLEGDGLIAVTRRYVNLLREE